MLTVTGTTIDAGAKYKMRARIACFAKQLVNIAAAIADVYVTCRIAKQGGRLPQIVHPAHTLLVLDWHASRIDMPFERGGALEFLACPELDRRQA